MNRSTCLAAAVLLCVVIPAPPTLAQMSGGSASVAGKQSSRNIHVVGQVPGRLTDIKIEQELSRPYAYVGTGSHHGFHIFDLRSPTQPERIYTWQLEDWELHVGNSLEPMYLKSHGRYYFAQSFQYRDGRGPDTDLGAIVFDVTGLPDTSTIEELVRIRVPEARGGFHNMFAYKHSDGRALLITSTYSPYAYIYDIDLVVSGDPHRAIVGKVPLGDINSFEPNTPGYVRYAYHDFYVGYDPATQRDLFYGPGQGGYYVFDITNVAEPKLVTSITGVAGVKWGHTFTPDPTGRYAIAETEYTYAPLRVFDLKPGLDGEVKNISRPIGAWTASWDGLPHNHEVRWPYVFVATNDDEFHVFNMMDPANPYTVGYYDSAPGVKLQGGRTFGIDVRNADGLIVTSGSGLGVFKMDGFDGWNGHQWGLPNISSAQDWDNGPDGAPKPQKVSVR